MARCFLGIWLPAVIAFSTFFLLAPTQAQAQLTVQSQFLNSKANEAWNEFTARNGETWRAEWSSSGDRAISLRGRWTPSPKVDADDAESIAAAFLADSADVLGLNVALSDLELANKRRSPMGTHMSFQQSSDGLPVFDGFVDIHVNKRGEVFLAHSSYSTQAAKGLLRKQPDLSSALASRAARSAHAGALLPDKRGGKLAPVDIIVTGEPKLGIQPMESGDRLAYRVIVGPIRYTVDAQSGEILQSRSLRQSINANGRVFDPNPVSTLKTALTDQDDRNYAALSGAYFDRVLRRITLDGAVYKLIGPYVRAMNFSSSQLLTTCGSSGWVGKAPPRRIDTNFIYNRRQSGFEHVNVYHHIDKSQRYIQFLGFDALFNRAIRVDAHAITADNSFYCSVPTGRGYLAFGDGGVDDAEDADVVLHEYGHALQDAASLGRYLGGGQTGAMGEGFGDYWSYQARPGGKYGNCFAEWDGEGGCLRKLSRNKRFPDDYVGQVHADGEIWSRGLRDLFLALGKSKANTIILASHYLIPANNNFRMGVDALLDADDALYSGDNREEICSTFVNRGISGRDCGYWMYLTWPLLGSDVDLHLRPPSCAGDTSSSCPDDVAWYNATPDWGVIGNPNDDPQLYVDCVTTCTFEQITAPSLPDVGTYRVLAHYYNDHAQGGTTATIEVYRRASRVFVGSMAMSDNDVWFAYDIVVSAPKAEPQLVEVNQLVRSPPGYAARAKKRR